MAGGTGTPTDPFLISTASEFLAIPNFGDLAYKQTNDLDFTGVTTRASALTFSGSYDGNGFKFKNFVLNNTSDCFVFFNFTWDY